MDVSGGYTRISGAGEVEKNGELGEHRRWDDSVAKADVDAHLVAGGSEGGL